MRIIAPASEPTGEMEIEPHAHDGEVAVGGHCKRFAERRGKRGRILADAIIEAFHAET